MDRHERKVGEFCREEFSQDVGMYFAWFKTYNTAMQNWLSGIKENRPETQNVEIPVLMSTPERALSDLKRPRVEGQVDLPVITFTMTGASFEQSRFVPSTIPFIRERVGDKWILQPKPMPWELNYNISVFAKYMVTLDIVAYALFSRFTPKSYLSVNGAASMITFTGHNDSSQLEPGANADRILRHDYQFKVDAWMPLPYKEVGMIRNIIIQVTNDLENDLTDEEIAEHGLDSDGITIITDFSDITEVNAGANKIPGVYIEEMTSEDNFDNTVITNGVNAIATKQN